MPRRGCVPGIATVGLALLGCGETPAGPPAVATVAVTSAIDSLLAVDRTAQLTAAVIDVNGDLMSDAMVTWTSSNSGVAIVNAEGLITGLAAGPVTITATSDGTSGNLAMRVVAADLAGITALLTDPYLPALVAALDPAARASLTGILADLGDATSQGHLSAMRQGLADAETIAAGSGSATTNVLFAVVRLYIVHAVRLLNV
jgi:hypothetical protein